MPPLPQQTYEFYDNSGGSDLKSSPTKVAENANTLSINMDYDVDGALLKRYGSSLENSGNQIIEGGVPARINGLFDYRKSDGTEVEIITTENDIYQNLNVPASYGFAFTTTNYPDLEFFVTNDDEYLIYGNGVDDNLKFNGTTWTDLSIAAPTTTCTAAIGAASTLPAGDYSYIVTFARYDAALDVVEQESEAFRAGVPPDLQFSNANTPLPNGAGNEVNLAAIPISPDPQVNARIIYRKVGLGNYFRVGVISDNVTLVFTDNVTTTLTDPLDLSIRNALPSRIFEEYEGRMFYAFEDKLSDLRYSAQADPWNVPVENLIILDGPIQCIKRCYGALLIGTDKSLWVLLGDPLTNSPKRISSKIGILNNRCAAGEGSIYILATNLKFYAIKPTDFADNEIRIDEPLSRIIDPAFNQINKANLYKIQLADYTKGDVSKILLSVPLGSTDNNYLFVFNETQSFAQGKPVWHFWDNWECNVLQEFVRNGDIDLIFGNYNGYIWHGDNQGIDGDGAEVNGTATAGTVVTIEDTPESGTATAGGASTLTDVGLSMTVNAYVGFYLAIIGGTGAGQTIRIQSNTADTFTIIGVWATIPDATSVYEVGPFEPSAYIGMRVLIVGGTNEGQASEITANTHNILTVAIPFSAAIDNTSEYSVGGFKAYHYTNWKSLTGSYDTIKQLWYFLSNLNAYGSYTIDLIIQFDFDQNLNNQIVIPLSLNLNNSIWGSFVWGEGIWGAVAVFQSRIRQFARFRAIRFGFRNNKAGQPFQVNGFSVTAQDKKQLFPSN